MYIHYVYVEMLRLITKGHKVIIRIGGPIGQNYTGLIFQYEVDRKGFDMQEWTAMWDSEDLQNRELLLAWLSDLVPGGTTFRLHPMAGGFGENV